MNIEILFFGAFRQVTGTDKLQLELEQGSTLGDLLQLLAIKYGDRFSEALERTQGLRILVDGREYKFVGGYEATLWNGCTVVLLPPVAGG